MITEKHKHSGARQDSDWGTVISKHAEQTPGGNSAVASIWKDCGVNQ